MRFPSFKTIVNPKRLTSGLLKQTAGVVIYAAANKFIPNKFARWGVYLFTSAFNIWYPITQEVLNETNLTASIESTF